jgi:predicted Rossmann-fold nucleotide-binding protein
MIFKVMSECVEGFEKLAKIGPCVTIFGSARVKPDHKYYRIAEDIAARVGESWLWCYNRWRAGYYGSG